MTFKNDLQGQKHCYRHLSCKFEEKKFRFFQWKNQFSNRKSVFSPERNILAQNGPQQSIPGVKKHRYRHLSCIYLEKIFFCNFDPKPKLGVAPRTTQHDFFQFFAGFRLCQHNKHFPPQTCFFLIVYQKMLHSLD